MVSENYYLGDKDKEFCEIVWATAPIRVKDLIALCAERLNWARSTTLTILRKFMDRGIFADEKGIVKVLISRDDFYSKQSNYYVDKYFKGSLPEFLAAFTSNKKMSSEEIEQLLTLVRKLQ